MAEKNTAPGKIGQMYQNRKTSKVYVLESFEPKFKTVMLRDTDGKSINAGYSTFRSSYRQYKNKDGEEEIKIETSYQVEEKKMAEKKLEKDADKVLKKKGRQPKVTEEEKKEIFDSLLVKIQGETKQYADISGIAPYVLKKGGIVLKWRPRKALCEFWPQYGKGAYDISYNTKFWEDMLNDGLEAKGYADIVEAVKFMPNWIMKYKSDKIPDEQFEGYLKCLLKLANDYVKIILDEEEEQKKIRDAEKKAEKESKKKEKKEKEEKEETE